MANIDTLDIDQDIVRLLRALGSDAPVIAPVHDLTLDLGIDSTELVELAIIARDQFGLAVKPDLRHVRTVQELTAEIVRLITSETDRA